MLKPSECLHPGEHWIKINGDLQKCENCGQLFVFKNERWIKK